MAQPRLRHVALLSLVLGYLGLNACSGARYAGPPSDHFDGERFFNPGGHDDHGLGDLLRWRLQRQPGAWPQTPLPAQVRPDPPQQVTEGVRVTFINHATFLIQMGGINILTDPIWSERTSPLAFVGPRRRAAPGLRREQLPPIDLILLSHNHYDHLDLPTLAYLAARDSPRLVTPLGNGVLVRGAGLSEVQELDWWQALKVRGVGITLVPAVHFSARSPFDRNRSLWGGFYLQQGEQRIYFAGDTGWGDHFTQIRQRLGAPSLALLPIGAYLPRWFMAAVHTAPEEALAAHRVLGAKTSLAMHFGTFPLADDALDDPVEALQAALREQPVDFRVLAHGESYISSVE